MQKYQYRLSAMKNTGIGPKKPNQLSSSRKDSWKAQGIIIICLFVINFIRTILRVILLRTILAIVRGKQSDAANLKTSRMLWIEIDWYIVHDDISSQCQNGQYYRPS